jgi:hypothetical protein
MLKTHSPFLIPGLARRLKEEPVVNYITSIQSDAGIGSFIFVGARNPFDNYNAWVRFQDKIDK